MPNLQLANAGERELDIAIGGHTSVEHGENVTHAQLDLVARERRLLRHRRVVERVYRYDSGYGVLVERQAMRLRELLSYREDRPLDEHVPVLTPDVELLLHEAERTKVRYVHASRL